VLLQYCVQHGYLGQVVRFADQQTLGLEHLAILAFGVRADLQHPRDCPEPCPHPRQADKLL